MTTWFRTACVSALLWGARPVIGNEVVLDTPSDDSWQYPFNFANGLRAAASCFGSHGNGEFPDFNDRDGVFIMAWDTRARIEPGMPPATYRVCSAEITLTNWPGARWTADGTVDEWTEYENRSNSDPGRPIELYGAGFGPRFTYATWTEASPYEGAFCDFLGTECINVPRDPFPFVFQPGTGAVLHVEDSVKGFHNDGLDDPLCDDPDGVCPFTAQPWAIGEVQPRTPEDTFDVVFDVDLTISDGNVRRYVQEQLSGGRVFVVVSSLQLVVQQQTATDYPNFFTKEAVGRFPGAKGPRLRIILSPELIGDADGDGDLDHDDIAPATDCLTGPVPEMHSGVIPDATCPCNFDTDHDGDVDLIDWSALERNYTGVRR